LFLQLNANIENSRFNASGDHSKLHIRELISNLRSLKNPDVENFLLKYEQAEQTATGKENSIEDQLISLRQTNESLKEQFTLQAKELTSLKESVKTSRHGESASCKDFNNKVRIQDNEDNITGQTHMRMDGSTPVIISRNVKYTLKEAQERIEDLESALVDERQLRLQEQRRATEKIAHLESDFRILRAETLGFHNKN